MTNFCIPSYVQAHELLSKIAFFWLDFGLSGWMLAYQVLAYQVGCWLNYSMLAYEVGCWLNRLQDVCFE
jgi:hypothetical protein